MKIIFGKKNAELITDQFLLLELPDVKIDDKVLDIFCAIEYSKLPENEFLDIERLKKLHNFLMNKLKNDPTDKDTIVSLVGELKGKFSGEVDSFYDFALGEQHAK